MPASTPAFHGNIGFNAQHSPMGAFMSFTCGHFGTRGGFGLQSGKPGNQDLYIGIKEGDRLSDAPLKVLPFYQGALEEGEAARYDVERAAGPSEQHARPRLLPYRREQIRRHYGWASDRWVTDDFAFAVYTPFGTLPSLGDADHGSGWIFPHLEQRYRLLPAVVATLTVDNTDGNATRTAFFAMKFPETGVRLLDRGLELSAGFAWRGSIGVAGRIETQEEGFCQVPFTFLRWAPDVGLRQQSAHRLGNAPGVGVEVPPGQRCTLQLVLGCHLAGAVTTRLEGRYFYTRFYPGLLDVLNRGFDHFDQLVEDSQELDARLLASGLSPDQQFLLAHSTRSYYGSTQLLEVGGQPLWVVNEGEYCMMNTLDLSVDQVFWELKHNPWVVRNLLDTFVRHYSYVDEVKDPAGRLRPGGISFTHDMGVHNNFSPFGHSSYELPGLTGCFSYMTGEQLCNWVLIAASYVARTEDLAWARDNRHVIEACLASLIARGPESGIISRDSSRCGDGSEITTYDSLDHSLAQTRNNVYMATKAWAAYQGLALVFEALGDVAGQNKSVEMSRRVETALLQEVQADGHLPAVFEKDSPGFGARILPAAEGLVYPLAWGRAPQALAPQASPLRDALKRHTLALLNDPQRRNLFPDGGIRLSSTSNNSWMSKIAIFQHVCRRVFRLDEDPKIRELFANADAAHVRWMTEGDSAYWACSDQFVNGVAVGSKYYPRVITTALWMERE